jgi:BON domain
MGDKAVGAEAERQFAFCEVGLEPQGNKNMSLSLAGGHRIPSALPATAPVLAHPVQGVIAGSSGVASSSAPAPPVLAPPSVSPIVQTVERRLRESSYYYLRSIRCSHEGGVITLRGRVPTFYLKQTVQSIVEKIDGVEQVVNLVEVFDSRQDVSPGLHVSDVRRTA